MFETRVNNNFKQITNLTTKLRGFLPMISYFHSTVVTDEASERFYGKEDFKQYSQLKFKTIHRKSLFKALLSPIMMLSPTFSL